MEIFIMKLILPTSNIPGYEKKIRNELTRVIDNQDNCVRLESYVATNGEMYPELSELYESLVDMAISNVEINQKSNVYARKDEEELQMRLCQRPVYMSNVLALKEYFLGTGVPVFAQYPKGHGDISVQRDNGVWCSII